MTREQAESLAYSLRIAYPNHEATPYTARTIGKRSEWGVKVTLKLELQKPPFNRIDN